MVDERAATADLSDALAYFFRQARRARGRAAAQPPAEGVSLAQFVLLEPLAQRSCTNGELAEEAGVASPTATRMIDVLAARGLVVRDKDPADKRTVVVSLTGAGREALALSSERFRHGREKIASALEPNERHVAADLLRRLADFLEEY